MGADGHIRFYDKLKVDRICKELRIKHKYSIHFPGVKCDYRVNGQYCYLDYWEAGGDMKSYVDQYYLAFAKEKKYIWNEFKQRINSEAILVDDMEIWT